MVSVNSSRYAKALRSRYDLWCKTKFQRKLENLVSGSIMTSDTSACAVIDQGIYIWHTTIDFNSLSFVCRLNLEKVANSNKENFNHQTNVHSLVHIICASICCSYYHVWFWNWAEM